MEENSKRLRNYCIAFIIGLILVIGCCIALKNDGVNPTLITGRKTFSDFAETMSYNVIKNPYTGEGAEIEVHSIYPPMAYLVVYPFALIDKAEMIEYLQGKILLQDIHQKPLFVFTFVLYYVITMILLMVVVAKYTKLNKLNLMYLLITFLCIGPFVYVFGRGNIIISTLLFVLLFFYLKDSDVRWKKEIANFFLALAIATKIYPVFFLIYFIKDKKFLDLLKTLIIAIALIFLPFALVPGRFDNIGVIWSNFQTFDSGEGRNDDATNISLDSTSRKVSFLFNVSEEKQDEIYAKISKFSRYGMLLIAIILLACMRKNTMEFYAMLLSILSYILFQGVSYGYTIMFLTIPIINFIMNYNTFKKVDRIIYSILFIIIMYPLLYVLKIFTLQSYALVFLLIKVIFDSIKIRFFEKNVDQKVDQKVEQN